MAKTKREYMELVWKASYLILFVFKVIMMDRGSTLYTPRLGRLRLRMTCSQKYAATTKVPYHPSKPLLEEGQYDVFGTVPEKHDRIAG